MSEPRTAKAGYSDLDRLLRRVGFVPVPKKPRRFWHERTGLAMEARVLKYTGIGFEATLDFDSISSAFTTEVYSWFRLLDPDSATGSNGFPFQDDDWLVRVEQCLAASTWFPFGHPARVEQVMIHLSDAAVPADITAWIQRINAKREELKRRSNSP